MSDGDHLLAAIIAHPEEDAPRLMYADWLDDNGQPERAEFIRVQCELASLPALLGNGHTGGEAAAYYERANALHYRGQKLLDSGTPRNHALWYDMPCGSPTYTRGFVSEVRAPATDWLAHGDAIVAEHPIERLLFTDVPILEGEEDDVGFANDATGARFAWVDVRDKAFFMNLDITEPGVIPRVVASLRWPGIEFQLPVIAHWA